jgi:hypothetical protein
VPIGVGVVGKGDVELVARADQPRHRIGRRAVHPDLAVPVHRHEAERRVDRVADDGSIEAIALDDRLPVAHARAAQRIDADLHAGAADRFHVEHVGEVGDIGPDVIVAANTSGFARAIVGDAFDASEIVFEKPVRGALDSRRNVGIRRTAIGRIIFEPAIFRRIMRRRDHDAVGKTMTAASVVGQDGVRNNRRRRIAVVRVDHHLDAVGREYLQRTRQRRLRQRVGVDAEEQRPADAACPPMIAKRLADGKDMRLVERVVEGRAAMPRGAEGDPLRRDRRVGLAGKIRRHQPRYIDQHRWGDDRAGQRVYFSSHLVSSMLQAEQRSAVLALGAPRRLPKSHVSLYKKPANTSGFTPLNPPLTPYITR